MSGGVLRHRDLRLVVVARALSFLGDEVALVALTLHAYDAGWGPRGIAAVFVAGALPLALAAPLAGRLVDRVDSRRATTLAALWQAAAALALAVVLAAGPSGAAGVALALLLVAAVSAGQSVAGPAWQALVPHVVPPDDVPAAVSAQQTATTLVGVAGPAIGGLLVAAGGAPAALLIDAVTYAVLAVAARTVRAVRRPQAGAGTDGLWAGFAALRADRLLAAVVGGLLAMILALQVVVVADVVLVREVLGAGPAGYGAVNAVFAVAMVAGAVVGGALRTPRAQAVGIVAVMGGMSLGVVGMGAAPGLVVLGAALAVVGLGNGVLNVAFGALLVARTPDAVRGRVFAAVGGVVQAANVGGFVLGGVVGELLAPRTVLATGGWAGAAVSVVVSAVVLRVLRAPGPAAVERVGALT